MSSFLLSGDLVFNSDHFKARVLQFIQTISIIKGAQGHGLCVPEECYELLRSCTSTIRFGSHIFLTILNLSSFNACSAQHFFWATWCYSIGCVPIPTSLMKCCNKSWINFKKYKKTTNNFWNFHSKSSTVNTFTVMISQTTRCDPLRGQIEGQNRTYTMNHILTY